MTESTPGQPMFPEREGEEKFTLNGKKEKKKKKWCTIYVQVKKEVRFNLKIGSHSSFLQMKAHKWKSLA